MKHKIMYLRATLSLIVSKKHVPTIILGNIWAPHLPTCKFSTRVHLVKRTKNIDIDEGKIKNKQKLTDD